MLPPPTLLLECVLIAAAGVGLLYVLRWLREKKRERAQRDWSTRPLEWELPAFGTDSIDHMLVLSSGAEASPLPSDLPRQFVTTLITSGFAFLGFNWVEWRDGEGGKLLTDPSLLDTADLMDIRKLFTYLWRQDHFCEGVLRNAFDAGLPQRALRRLAAIREAR